jgi:hypothetical protein
MPSKYPVHLGRDFAQEMRALIDSETGGEDFIPAVVAHQLVEKLSVSDPGLLNGWLYAQAETLLAEAISSRMRSQRSSTRVRSRSTAFAQAALAGDVSGFLVLRYVAADGSRRKLADFTHEDLLHAADDYGRRADSNAMEAAFFRAIARRVQSGVVKDHLDEAQLLQLRRLLEKP